MRCNERQDLIVRTAHPPCITTRHNITARKRLHLNPPFLSCFFAEATFPEHTHPTTRRDTKSPTYLENEVFDALILRRR